MVRHVLKANYSYLIGESRKHLLAAVALLSIALLMTIIPTYGIFIAGGLLLVSVGQFGRIMPYLKGMSGEKRVSKALQKLDNEFCLLDDVLLYPGGGNIDHIVLGHNGIFVIETKNYNGVVRCFGDTWYLASHPKAKGMKIDSISVQVKNNAKMLYRFLRSNVVGNFVNRLFIKPILVFTNGSMEMDTRNPTVIITRPKMLRKLISNLDTGLYFSKWELEKMAKAIKMKASTHD